MKKKGDSSFKKYFFPLSKRWDFLVVFLFLLIRLSLNIKLAPLFVFFAVSYVILILFMFMYKKGFFAGTIVFLFIDSLIGTFLYTTNNNLGLEYYGTMLINLFMILIQFNYEISFHSHLSNSINLTLSNVYF